MKKNLAGKKWAAAAAPKFNRQRTKLGRDVQAAVDKEVQAILENPLSGEPKKGPLRGVRVRKFTVGTPLYLLAYELGGRERQAVMVAVGVHENFYRDLADYR
ncbi:MAG: type II toxin-antitoxin system RelE/ParE family toxin [Candidatus Methylomirabilales bacterium]